MAGVHQELLEGAQLKIQSLNLEDFTDDKVVIRKLPRDRGATKYGEFPKPGIILSPFGNMQIVGGTNCRDDVVYPVLVTILAADNQDLVANLDKYTTWANRVRRRFIEQRTVETLTLPGADHYNTNVRPGPTVAPQDWMDNIWHSNQVLRCFVREPRGHT